MNLTERAEIRKETFYKLTNSRDVPEAPSVGGRNYLHGTSTSYQKYTGTNYILGYPSTYRDWTKLLDPLRGKTVTIKAYIKNDTNYPVRIQMWFTGGGVYGNAIPAHSEGWSVKTGKMLSNWTSANVAFTQEGQNATGGTIQAKEVKVEVSESATPYSKAPEDLGWSTDTLVPTQSNRYLWKFEYIYYSDGSVENTQPVNISIAGADGTNGQTSHVHFAFADNATGGGFSLTTPKAYMGWYADFNEAASTDPTKYRWSKWKGDQGLPGKPGADGKTSYFHMAYADSADGRTGFSFKESGQQYQGYYTDFTQSSSTDPTKYTWMDRRAGIEVDFRNLLSKTNRGKTNWSWIISSGGTTPEDYNVDGINAVKLTRTSDASFSWDYIQYQGLLRNLIEPNTKYTLSFDIKPSVDVTFTASLRRGDSGAPLTNSTTMNKATANQWNKVSCVLTSKTTLPDDLSQVVYLQGMPVAKGNYLIIKNIKLGKGNVPTPWLPALEDVQDDIDSKADQALTQEQLNALAEKNSIIKAEMEAKASIDTVNQWITAYQNYVNANDEARAESEKNLQEAAARILQLKTDVGALRQQWDFIDTYMSIQNEGLIIGKSDGSAFAKFANDRISLFSGSSEVMYISQGTLHIENGIFTKTIQIGRFRFETHPADKDMLVLRYLGG